MTDRRRRLVEGYGRKVAVGLLGGMLVAAGLVLMVLPGPGIAVALLGLAVLAREFSWAKRALQWSRSRYRVVMARIRRARAERTRRHAGRVDGAGRGAGAHGTATDRHGDRTAV